MVSKSQALPSLLVSRGIEHRNAGQGERLRCRKLVKASCSGVGQYRRWDARNERDVQEFRRR